MFIQLGNAGYIGGPAADRPWQTFFRYCDQITGKIVKVIGGFPMPGSNQSEVDASMSEWVKTYFRNAEYIPGSAEIYNTQTHAGTLYPIPLQNILTHCTTPAYKVPPPRRISVLIQKQVPGKQLSRRILAARG